MNNDLISYVTFVCAVVGAIVLFGMEHALILALALSALLLKE